ncbi:hypothetical protein EBT25_02415 [bacterium]|nr:hypothetical protein [bacterium]
METGKCNRCARRQRLIMPCKSCTGKFCSACIQLEIHVCPELSARKQLEREKLERSNPLVTTPKLQKI